MEAKSEHGVLVEAKSEHGVVEAKSEHGVSLLLLAATVWGFARLPLGVSDRNSINRFKWRISNGPSNSVKI